MSRVNIPENSAAAIQRLLSTQHVTPGVTIEQLAMNEIAARVNDESALITFDDDNHQFTISDYDGLVQRVLTGDLSATQAQIVVDSYIASHH